MKTVRFAIGLALFALSAGTAVAQDIKIERLLLDNGQPTHNSAILKASPLSSTTYTLILPTGTTTANNVLTVTGVSGNDLTMGWSNPSATQWSLTGNSGLTNGVNNLFGTNDAIPVLMRTNGVARIRLINDADALGAGGVVLLSNNNISQQLRFQNPAGTFTSSFQAGAQGSNISYTLPLTLPGTGTTGILRSDDSGGLNWEPTTNFEAPLTFTNGLTRTSNTIKLGGTLTDPSTTLNLNGNDLTISGTGNITVTQFGPAAGVVKNSTTGVLSSGLVNLTTEVTGILPIANGGTNSNTIGGNGTVAYSTGTALGYSAVGTSGQVLTSTGAGAPAWTSISALVPANNGLSKSLDTVQLGGTLNKNTSVALNGNSFSLTGTGNVAITQFTSSGIVKNDASGVLSSGQVNLASSSEVTGILPIANGGTNTNTIGIAGTVPYSTGTALGYSAVGTTGQVLTSGGAGAPTWTSISALVPANNGLSKSLDTVQLGGTLNKNTAIALNGNNFSLTGTGNVAITQFASAGVVKNNAAGVLSSGQVNLASSTDVTGVLGITNGGTGTSAVPGNGTILIGNGTGYTLGTITGGTGISVNNGAGTITISSSILDPGTVNNSTLRWNTATSRWTENTNILSTAAGNLSVAAGITLSGATSPLTTGGTAGTAGQVLTSGGAGNSPAWTSISALVPANNGLSKSLDTVQLGGTLNKNTAIALNGNSFSLTGTGNVAITQFASAGIVKNNASGVLSSGQVNLASSSEVTGILPIANGGTNTNTIGAAGTVAYSTGTGLGYSAVGTSGQVLTSTGASAPAWTSISALVPANNGLSKNLDTVQLGGTLNKNTAIALNGNNLSLTGTGNVAITQFSTKGVVKNYASGVLYSGPIRLDSATDVTGILGITNGGTGTSAVPGNGTILIGNGTGYTLGTITGGTGISVNNGAGTITISSSILDPGTVNNSTLRWNTATSRWTENTNILSTSAGNLSVAAGLTLSGATSPLTTGGTAGTAGQVLTSGGAGNSPAWTSVSALTPANNGLSKSLDTVQLGGTLNKNTAVALNGNSFSLTGTGNVAITQFSSAGIVKNNASGVLSSGQVNLASSSDVTGILPIANGGTNSNTIGVAGTVPYSTGTALGYSAVGTSGQVLISGGSGAPTWTNATNLYTADNGITKTGTNFQLGGALTAATTITNGGFDFTFAKNAATGNVQLTSSNAAANQLQFFAPSSSPNYAAIQAPSLSASYTLTLPVDDGTTGQILSTDGNGVLSWIANTGASGWLLTGNNINSSDYIGPNNGNDFRFRSGSGGNNALHMVMLSNANADNGYIGINPRNNSNGQTDPRDWLDVRGNIRISNERYTGGNTANNSGNAGELRFMETNDGAEYTAFLAGSQATNLVYTLPTTAPTAGQVLSSSGGNSSTLSWTTIPAATVTGANNGLTLNTGNVQLGGTLNQTTSIDLSTFNLTLGTGATATGDIIFGGTNASSDIIVSKFSSAGIVKNNASGVLSSGAVNLASTEVTGILGISNGGTNSAGPIGGNGTIVYSNGTGYAYSAVGTSGQVLISGGAGAPTWTDATNLYTADNGITKTGTNFQLGGALTAATAITQAGFNMDFSKTGTGNVRLTNNGTANQLQFLEPSASGNNYSALLAQAQTADLKYIFPATGGTANQVLAIASKTGAALNDSTMTLVWTTPASAPITAADNGLNLSGSTVKLGGTLTASTSIPFGANNLTLSSSGDAGNVIIGKFTTAGIVKNSAAGVLSSGAVNLASTEVTGVLGIANGGTNSNSIGAAGTVPYSTGTALGYSAVGTSGQVLISGGAGAPTWTNATNLYTADNGITKTGTNFQLGGALTTATTITLAANDLTLLGSGADTASVVIGNSNNLGGELKFNEPSSSGSNFSSFRAAAQSADIKYVLPNTAPTANQVLTTSAISGNSYTLSWTTPSAATVTGANNGLSMSGTTVQLGGALIGNTTIDLSASNIIFSRSGTGAVQLTNTNNTANQLQLFEPSTSGSNYSALLSQAQTADLKYVFPATGGTVNQVLTIASKTGASATDSTLTLAWTTPSGSGTGWSITGNAGTGASNFLGTTDNTAMQIRVNSSHQMIFNTNSSIQRDNSGNARGTNAVDLQNTRSAATQVASGANSFIGAGQNNTANANYSAVIGGQSNQAINQDAVVIGGTTNIANAIESSVLGGASNTASNQYSTVVGGSTNTANAIASAVVGGTNNIAANQNSFIGGGSSNTVNGTTNSAIVGGTGNTINDLGSFIAGGTGSTIDGSYSAIVGGQNLRLGARSFGFNATGTTNMNTYTDIAYIGNAHTFIGNNDNTARALRFMEPTAAPGTADYTSFQAGAQSGNIIYTLPTTAPTAGQVLTSSGGATSTLSWTTVSGGSESTTASNGLTLSGTDVRLGGSLTAATTITLAGNNLSFAKSAAGVVQLTNTNNTANRLEFYEPSTSGSNYSALRAGAQSANFIYTLPTTAGTANQVLSISSIATDTVNLAWVAGGGTVTGSGTATQIAYWNSSSSITSESNLFWDPTNDRLGIGTSSPTQSFDVLDGNIFLSTSNSTQGELRFEEDQANGSNYIALRSPDALSSNVTLTLPTTDGNANEVLATDGAGNLSWVAGGGTLTGSGTATQVAYWNSSSSLTSESNLFWDPTNNRLGIGTSSPTQSLDVLDGNIFLSTSNSTQGELRFEEDQANGSSYIALRSPNALSANVTLTLPIDAGSSGEVLSTDGSGNLSWVAGGGTVTGSGTATQVAYWSSSSAITSESNLFWDPTNNRLGIGTSSPTQSLDVLDGNIFLSTSNSTQGELRFEEDQANGSSYIALRSPDALAANVTLTLPTTDGNANEVLATDGSGNLSWVAAGGESTTASNGLNLSGTDVRLGGSLTVGTTVTLAGFNLDFDKSSASGNVRLRSSGGTANELQFYEPANSQYTAFKAGSQSSNLTYTLPTTAPTANQALVSSGGTSSNLSWASVVTGVTIIRQTINYNIPSIGTSSDEGEDTAVWTVTGAQVGGSVVVSPASNLPSGIIISWARVSAANEVTVKFRNDEYPFQAINPSAMDFYVTVIQP